ncbi:helix-turn-helix domain-containing protein [Aquimarina litoralis]|uniref:helix-turn-helix domain-containing protein n=1 Tax=Aquimarina litoralis TaxID=584605 RepID=UPI001C55EFEA|nr:helix-turn-helix domain-containing protein [Aquimarina litoralis]MBW1297870.1 helix-turn-helix domain-containing protein [Aquimarina litoralis]
MTFDNPILFLLSSLGVFNGFLISLYFLFFSRQKRVQNFFLGLLLLMLSIRIGKSVYVLFGGERDRLILQVGLSACFLIGVSLYHYIKACIENRKTIPRSWIIHIGLLFVIVTVIGIIRPYTKYIDFWNSYFVKFIYGTWGIYLLLSGFLLKDVIKKIFHKNVTTLTSELWLFAVFMANVLIFAAYMIGYFYFYLIGTITFSAVFYGLIIFLLFKKNRDNIFQDIPEKYAAKKIEDKEASDLIAQLTSLARDKQLYKNPNVKLKDFSSEIHISSHKLSQLLNDNLGKSFAFFINEYRIEESQRLLRENNNYTLEAIGFEAGFSSKSSFYATFKKMVGVTPAQYKKQFSE